MHSLSEQPFIRTTTAEVTGELDVRRSRFIAFLAPCKTKEEAMAYVGVLRTTYWDAVHHCYAYRLGPDGMEYRMSDDGEPSGTAGKPLLFCLQQARLTNCIVVVVRYFGGVKLGVGPLARAYSDAAIVVISSAEIVPIIPRERAHVYCPYDDVSRIIELLQEYQVEYETEYADAVTFTVSVPQHRSEEVARLVVDRTNARAGYSKITAE